MKFYCRLALTIFEFDQTDIVTTSNGQFAAYDANDVMCVRKIEVSRRGKGP